MESLPQDLLLIIFRHTQRGADACSLGTLRVCSRRFYVTTGVYVEKMLREIHDKINEAERSLFSNLKKHAAVVLLYRRRCSQCFKEFSYGDPAASRQDQPVCWECVLENDAWQRKVVCYKWRPDRKRFFAYSVSLN
jgi:hypothetical protein